MSNCCQMLFCFPAGESNPGHRVVYHIGGLRLGPPHHVQRPLRGQRVLDAAAGKGEAGAAQSVQTNSEQ